MRLSKQDFMEYVVAPRTRVNSSEVKNKRELSEKLAAQVDEFLKHSEITVIPAGVSLEFGGVPVKLVNPLSKESRQEAKQRRIKEQQELLLRYQEKVGHGCWSKLADVVGRKFIAPSQLRTVAKGKGEIIKSWPEVKIAVEMELGEQS